MMKVYFHLHLLSLSSWDVFLILCLLVVLLVVVVGRCEISNIVVDIKRPVRGAKPDAAASDEATVLRK